MSKLIAPIIALVCASLCSLHAQHSSSDFKDAATTGPFPLYFGGGYANSFRNQDLVDVSKHFAKHYSGDYDYITRLYGIYALAGTSIIPKNWPLSFGLEVKHLWLHRSMRVADQQFKLISNQTSLCVGIRFATFPIVWQLQGGPVLGYGRNYKFRIPGEVKTFNFKSGTQGWTLSARAGILDPAGTEGGLGLYLEAGMTWLNRNPHNDEIANAIRTYDPTFNTTQNSIGRYGYFSVGVLLPVAIRIK